MLTTLAVTFALVNLALDMAWRTDPRNPSETRP